MIFDIAKLDALRNTLDKPYKVKRWAFIEDGQVLYDLVQSNNIRSVVEIGTAAGFTAVCMAAAGAIVRTYDPQTLPKIWDRPDFPYPELVQKILFTPMGAPECFKNTTFPGTPTLFFIDGDHSLVAVTRDFNDVHEFAWHGDLIVLHDVIANTDVAKFWTEVVHAYPDKTQTFKTRYGIGLFRP